MLLIVVECSPVGVEVHVDHLQVRQLVSDCLPVLIIAYTLVAVPQNRQTLDLVQLVYELSVFKDLPNTDRTVLLVLNIQRPRSCEPEASGVLIELLAD